MRLFNLVVDILSVLLYLVVGLVLVINPEHNAKLVPIAIGLIILTCGKINVYLDIKKRN